MTLFRWFPAITILAFAAVPFISAAWGCDERYPSTCSVSLTASRAVHKTSPVYRARAFYRVKRRNLVIPNVRDRRPVYRTIENPAEPLKIPPQKNKGDKFQFSEVISMSVAPIVPLAVRTMAYAAEPRRIWPPEIIAPRAEIVAAPHREIAWLHTAAGKAVMAGLLTFTIAGLVLMTCLGIEPKFLKQEADNERHREARRAEYRRSLDAFGQAVCSALDRFAEWIGAGNRQDHPARQRDWLIVG